MNLQKITAKRVVDELMSNADPARAKGAARYFKTGPGEYGHGDEFMGLTVPIQRAIAKKYMDLPLGEIKKLIHHKIHECRLTALLILVLKYRKEEKKEQKKIVRFYLANLKGVNNWDMVDSSASYILGNYLIGKPKKILYELAVSKNVWKRRVAIISTQAFIAQNRFDDTLRIAKILMRDPHDLIHKATGWMLREVGKKSEITEREFLEKYAATMPRTMLRYAIEKFPPNERKRFLNAHLT